MKKRIALILTVLLGISVLAGCGSSKAPEAAVSTEASGEVSEEAAEEEISAENLDRFKKRGHYLTFRRVLIGDSSEFSAGSTARAWTLKSYPTPELRPKIVVFTVPETAVTETVLQS